jgi:hypothetical protein
MRQRSLLAIFLVVVIGCAEGEPNPPDAAVVDAEVDSGPACTHHSNDRLWPCQQPEGACPALFLDMQGHPFTEDSAPQAQVSTLEDVRCVLRALRDGSPGAYTLITEYDEQTGLTWLAQTEYRFHVLEDGTVVRSYANTYDLLLRYSWSHLQPKPDEFFDACLSEPFGPALYECLVASYEQGAPSTCPICPIP